MLAPAKGGPADPACPARPPRRTFQAKSLPMAPVSRPYVPRDGPCLRAQRTRSQAETDPSQHRQRPFPIVTSQPPAASSLGGFPTRAVLAPSCALTPRPASKNLHQSGRSRSLVRRAAASLIGPLVQSAASCVTKSAAWGENTCRAGRFRRTSRQAARYCGSVGPVDRTTEKLHGSGPQKCRL